jgi:hypothetical protein
VAARRLSIQARASIQASSQLAAWIFVCIGVDTRLRGQLRLFRGLGWQNSQVHVSEEPLVCSARGCRAKAVHALRWNNPKLHTPERRKTWLACDSHLTSLSDFLNARGFLREVEPVAPG